jgi:hypothetical protein
MWFRLVADVAMVAHFAFLAYLVVGGFLAWRWPRTIWLHVATATYGFFNATVGWPCPLTYVENWGRGRAGDATLPATGFIDHYIAGVVYPQEHETLVQLLVALVVLVSWVGFAVRRRRAGRAASHTPGMPVTRAAPTTRP